MKKYKIGKKISRNKKKEAMNIKIKLSLITNFLSDMYQSQFEVVGLTFNVNLILIRQQKVAKFSSKLFYVWRKV